MSPISKNEAGFDRLLRVIVGAALLSLVFIGPRTLWGYLGVVLIVTGLAGICPLYSIFGVTTCPAPRAAHRSRPTKLS